MYTSQISESISIFSTVMDESSASSSSSLSGAIVQRWSIASSISLHFRSNAFSFLFSSLTEAGVARACTLPMCWASSLMISVFFPLWALLLCTESGCVSSVAVWVFVSCKRVLEYLL